MRVPNPSLRFLLSVTILSLSIAFILSEQTQATPFNPPSGGTPTGRGGASRGGICAGDSTSFTEQFVPITPSNSQSGLTLAERPSFLVNVPKSTAQKIFFILKDESGKIYYQTTLPIDGRHGILQINLPASVSPLEVDKQYEWGVAIICTDKLQPDSPFVSSRIRRVAPSANLVTHLSKASSIDKAKLYGTNGIWYDAVTTLARSRKQEPTNTLLQSAWSDLLNQAGLGEIASQPLQ